MVGTVSGGGDSVKWWGQRQVVRTASRDEDSVGGDSVRCWGQRQVVTTVSGGGDSVKW